MVVQEITLQAPDLVRRLIVDGAGPRRRPGNGVDSPGYTALFGAHPTIRRGCLARGQFSPSAAGQAAGRAFLKRTHLRQRAAIPSERQVSPAQSSDSQLGRPARGGQRLSEDDQAANTQSVKAQRVNIPTVTLSSCSRTIVVRSCLIVFSNRGPLLLDAPIANRFDLGGPTPCRSLRDRGLLPKMRALQEGPSRRLACRGRTEFDDASQTPSADRGGGRQRAAV